MANSFFRGRDVSPMQSFVRFLKESDGILILDKTALQYIHDHDAVSNQRVMAPRLSALTWLSHTGSPCQSSCCGTRCLPMRRCVVDSHTGPVVDIRSFLVSNYFVKSFHNPLWKMIKMSMWCNYDELTTRDILNQFISTNCDWDILPLNMTLKYMYTFPHH